MLVKSYGQIAYEAYSTVVTDAVLWLALADEEKSAWQAAAAAARVAK